MVETSYPEICGPGVVGVASIALIVSIMALSPLIPVIPFSTEMGFTGETVETPALDRIRL